MLVGQNTSVSDSVGKDIFGLGVNVSMGRSIEPLAKWLPVRRKGYVLSEQARIPHVQPDTGYECIETARRAV